MTSLIFLPYQRTLSCQKIFNFGRNSMLFSRENELFSLAISSTARATGDIAEWEILGQFNKSGRYR